MSSKKPYLGPLQPVSPRRPAVAQKRVEAHRGPGSHDLSKALTVSKKKAPSHSFGKSKRVLRMGPTTSQPPASIALQLASLQRQRSAFSKQVESRMSTAPSAPFTTSPRFPNPPRDPRPSAYSGHDDIADPRDIWKSPRRDTGLGGRAVRPALHEDRRVIPGPGAHTLPTSIRVAGKAKDGFGGATRESAAKSSGASSFYDSFETPGPSVYFPNASSSLGTQGPKVTMGDRSFDPGPAPLPGPGYYSPKKVDDKHEPAWPFGTEDRVKNCPKSSADAVRASKDVPGPGTYGTPSRPSSSRAPRFSFGTSTRKSFGRVVKLTDRPMVRAFQLDG